MTDLRQILFFFFRGTRVFPRSGREKLYPCHSWKGEKWRHEDRSGWWGSLVCLLCLKDTWVTSLLSFTVRGCFTFISSHTWTCIGIKSYLMERMRLHDRKNKTSWRRGWSKAELWLAEQTRKSGCLLHHLTLTLGFTICLPATTWLPSSNFPTLRPSCGSSFSPLSVRWRLPTWGTLWLWSWSPSCPWWASAPVSDGTRGGGTGSCEADFPACVPVARCCHPNTSLTVRNQPGLTYDPLWLIKKCAFMG